MYSRSFSSERSCGAFPVFPSLLIAPLLLEDYKLMGTHAAGYLLDLVPGLAFLFSVMIPYNGILAIWVS